MIDVERLSKHYHSIQAVDRVSFAVGRGEIVGLLGPNGAGKTTTMRMLTTFLPPTSGRARRSAGHDVLDEPLEVRTTCRLSARKRAALPRDAGPRISELSRQAQGRPRDRAPWRRSTRSSSAASSGDVESAMLGHLSKGYRQRVGLAEAMVHDPDILILDEPTAGLDPMQIREVRSLIRGLGDRHTILLSTHIMSRSRPSAAG